MTGGGAGGSEAYAFPSEGASNWQTFSTPVKDSTTVRFKLKPLGDIGEVTVLIWSKKQKDNCRYRIGGLKKGQWREVEFRAIEARVGWGMKGPSLEGDVLDNFKLLFEGGAKTVERKPYTACCSAEGNRWVIITWEPCGRGWANPKIPCMHCDPRFPDCRPGETRRLRGWLSFCQGSDVQAEIRRIEGTGWREREKLPRQP